MPATSNNATIRLYGTNTPNRTPDTATLQSRELFVNTYNSYTVNSISLLSGGVNYASDDVGRVATVSISGAMQIEPVSVVIQSVSSDGRITQVGLVNSGAFSVLPTVVAGNLVLVGTSGSGAMVTLAYNTSPQTETGGGLYVADATEVNEYVRLTGSLGAQNYNNVNITGGHVSNVTLTNATLVGSASAPTQLTNPTITRGTLTDVVIDSSEITNSTLIDVTIGTALAPVEEAYFTNIHLPLRGLPSGITSAGVVILGSDGILYATPTPVVQGMTVVQNLKVIGGIGVGQAINNTTAGSIRAANDVTAFAQV